MHAKFPHIYLFLFFVLNLFFSGKVSVLLDDIGKGRDIEQFISRIQRSLLEGIPCPYWKFPQKGRKTHIPPTYFKTGNMESFRTLKINNWVSKFSNSFQPKYFYCILFRMSQQSEDTLREEADFPIDPPHVH